MNIIKTLTLCLLVSTVTTHAMKRGRPVMECKRPLKRRRTTEQPPSTTTIVVILAESTPAPAVPPNFAPETEAMFRIALAQMWAK